jgi:ketosteroid isomerase-like protein
MSMSQHTQIHSPAELARTFVTTWASGDAAALGALVTDDIDYAGPLNRAQGRDEYLDVVAGFIGLVEDVEVLHVATDDDGDGAVIFYFAATETAGRLPVAQHLRFADDGRLAWTRLIFDTFPVRGG